METSSRIFVKGLPPTITEADFKKHFSFQGRETTDVRLFSNRRIGYVGYRTSDDAAKAVKYFNKSFVRMSRIGVELARPPGERTAPTAPKTRVEDRPTVLSKDKTQSNGAPPSEVEDPKLKEFLEVMKSKSKKRAWENDDLMGQAIVADTKGNDVQKAVVEEPSDNEYEDVPRSTKRARRESETAKEARKEPQNHEAEVDETTQPPAHDPTAEIATDAVPPSSDQDWARSRTSRLLGLLDEEEEADEPVRAEDSDEELLDAPTSTELVGTQGSSQERDLTTQPSRHGESQDAEDVPSAVRSSMRIFLRNLPFDVNESELEEEFASFGHLEEVHVALNKKTGTGKGFAYIQFSDPDSAERAMKEKDGQTYQGRLLHILAADAKRDTNLNEFELSKLPLKKQQAITRRREAASTQFNWNALYLNPDAVVSSVASRLGISKSDVLDPTSSDAAVKQAHAETHVIQETKQFFKSQGVDLDAFKRSQRGDTAVLVKNIPYDASRDELKRLFEEHGKIRRFLMPPSGVIAIVEMGNAAQTKAAFNALAYRRIKSSMLFLEKAPKDLFTLPTGGPTDIAAEEGIAKVSTSDLKTTADSDLTVRDAPGTATLFVRNLNFDTTTAQLVESFSPLAGFLGARVKTRTDPKKPGQILSMGFGFMEFRSSSEAQAALRAMDGYTLHGHKLQIRASHKGADAAEEQRKANQAKREAGSKTKVVIKNLPFEATKKDVRALFGAYGQLRSVRVPKKMDRAARGFAFADFTTPKEAQSALDALRDTHLLGRRLVLDFAAQEPADAEEEIERMAAKVGGQTNAVAVQKLVGQGRQKFTTRGEDEQEN